MIVNTAGLSAIFTGFKGNFGTGFGRAQPKYLQVATEIPSGTASNLYGFLGQFPQLREWIGDRQIKNIKAHDYTLVNRDFESTVEVKRNDIEDDTFGVYAPLMEELGYAAGMHPDSLIFALLAAGATGLCYDGQAFFDASHPVGSSTVSNYDASGGGNLWALMDTKHPMKPLIFQKRRKYTFTSMQNAKDQSVWTRAAYQYGVDGRGNAGYGLWQMAYGSLNTLNSTNVDTYMATILNLKGDEGTPLNIQPDTICVGPSNWTAARNLVGVERLANGQDNPYFKAFKIVLSAYLT